MVKSHGDDLGLKYLWNGDEYGSLENSLKVMEKNAEYGGQAEILALVHVLGRPITVHSEDSDKGTVFGEFFTDRPSIDILYYPEERDDNQVIPSHGNPQMRWTLFGGYLFKYCSVKYQTFHQVSEKSSQQTYSHQKKKTLEKLSRGLQEP